MGKLKSYDHLIGQKSYHLTVVDVVKNGNQQKLKCKCDCGNEVIYNPNVFVNGTVKSCGCYKIKKLNDYNKTHTHIPWNKNNNMGKHPLHGTWSQMIARCEHPQNTMYKHYGARGISVCEEWHDFWKFVEWSDSIGGRPDGYTLDRINVDGNYEPSNCRWTDGKTQSRNTSRSIHVTYNGKTQVLKDWSIELGIPYKTLSYRYKKGFPLDDVFSKEKFTKFPRHKVLNCYDKDGNLLHSYNNFSELPTQYNPCMITQSIYRGGTYLKLYWKYEDK